MTFIRSYCLLLILVMTVQTALAQLQIDASYTPQQLVENVLIGQGVQVSNFQFTGNAASRGFFDGSASNIGLSSGVILSTGRVIDAIGPNNTQAGSLAEDGTGFSTPGDAALTAISGLSVGTYDASILEFDFIPSSDTVQFRYVFASDEYMVWVDTSVSINDVFAFLISGPGISGESNIALLPGTTLPITMLNVNASTNSQYYIDNGDDPGESGGATVSYNGFTKVLTAQAVLTPCQSYHIRLAIADGGDGTYDSAVFLEAGSFSSPTVSMSAESSFSATSGGQDLVEGCSSTTLTFERSAPFDAPLTVGLAFSGTATVGADISNLPSSITFPAGQATTTISFNVIEDGVLEGTENLTIVLDQLNPCATGPATSVTITIQDALPLTLQISPDVSLICPEERIISVVPTGGYPTYQYQWAGTSSSTGSVTVNPFSSSTYTVMVTDTCGFTATASTSITIPNYQPIQVNVTDAIICNGEEAILEAQVSGGLGNITYLWDGSGTDATYAVSPVASTTVLLQVTDSCGITEDGQANVIVDEVDVSFTSKLTAHSTVQFTSSSTDITDFAWDFGDGTFGFRESPLHEYLEEGTYIVTLTVTNSNGCEATVEDTVTVYPPLHVYVPNSFTPNGDGINDEFGMIGEGYLYYDMEIFDRWGNRLKFGRFKDDTVWDGTYKGSLVPAGMYIYSIVVHPPIGIDVREKGSLFVLP